MKLFNSGIDLMVTLMVELQNNLKMKCVVKIDNTRGGITFLNAKCSCRNIEKLAQLLNQTEIIK